MIYEGESLKFRESEDAVKTEFMELIRNIIGSFDKLLHPLFTKSAIETPTPTKSLKLGLFNFD